MAPQQQQQQQRRQRQRRRCSSSGGGSSSSSCSCRLLRLVVLCCATFSWFSSSRLCAARRLQPHHEQSAHLGQPSAFRAQRPKHLQAEPRTRNSTFSTTGRVENPLPGLDSKPGASTRHATSEFPSKAEESGAHSEASWRSPDDSGGPVEALSKAVLLQRIHELLQRLNQQNILLEAEKSRCAAEVAAVKTEQLLAATKQMEELGNYSRAVRGELAQKCEKDSRKSRHEVELLEAEKLHCMKREEECDLRAERWRNVSVQHKAMFSKKVRTRGARCLLTFGF